MQRSSYVMVDTIQNFQMSSVMSITRMQDDWVVVEKDDVSGFQWKSFANKVKMNSSGWNIINYHENEKISSAEKDNDKNIAEQLQANMTAGQVWNDIHKVGSWSSGSGWDHISLSD